MSFICGEHGWGNDQASCPICAAVLVQSQGAQRQIETGLSNYKLKKVDNIMAYTCLKHGCGSTQGSCPFCAEDERKECHMPDNQGTKHDTGKPPCELLPPVALLEIAKVLECGRKKYASWNWAKGLSYSRVIGAILRHVYAYMRGEDKDPETGLSHIAHAACECLFLLHFEQFKKEFDDRPKDIYEIS